MRKILVVAVHPDDETLGCGGTLLKHRAAGDEIIWLLCTGKQEVHAVAKQFNFAKTIQLGLTTTKVDTYAMGDLIEKISAVFQEEKPHTVYLPFKNDVHSDHRKIFEAAFACTKSFRYPFIKKVLMMETLSETEFAPSTKEDCFVPNVFVDISAHFAKKCDILNLYPTEMGEHPFPRSVRNITALATLRGATAGCDYAESFVLLKETL